MDWYYCKNAWKPCSFGEEILVKPFRTICVPIDKNVRISLRNNGEYFLLKKGIDSDYTEILLSDENISFKNDTLTIFETKYSPNLEDIVSLDQLEKIPQRIKKKFLKRVPKGIKKLANELVGNETDTLLILKEFYNFVRTHYKSYSPTTGKKIETLLKEYKKHNHFYGNCKEISSFYAALCNSKGLPVKKVIGKSRGKGAHIWTEVCVPTEKSYRWTPVDPALHYFNQLSYNKHLPVTRLPSYTPIHTIHNIITRQLYFKIKIDRL